jgi:nucleoside-diphosphate-sugar epimerase
MKIVITGGTGFVGQAVAEVYIRAGQQVFVVGR